MIDHPSGSLEPSREDHDITARLKSAGEALAKFTPAPSTRPSSTRSFRTRCRRSSRPSCCWYVALRRSGGNQAIAAMMLGITRQALNNRLKKTADAS